MAEQTDRQAYLRRCMESDYEVECERSGGKALTRAKRLRPSVIVAEARMKGMSGIDVCEALSRERELRGTAVLLLVGEEGEGARAGALRAGADAVLATPTDPGLLKAQVDALYTQRRQYRERIVQEVQSAEGEPEDPFVTRARQAVDRHLPDEDFGPQDLADAVALSYVQCYRRLRDELDQTPSQFIRAVRLDHAATLLRQGAESIRQVASAVGFGSASYFSRCFREHVGQTPSDYREDRRGGET